MPDILGKKYDIVDPQSQAQEIDDMFDDLYRQMSDSVGIVTDPYELVYLDVDGNFASLDNVATGNALISGGTDALFSWGKIDLTAHVTGTLPVTNGGTGTATAFTAGSVVFAGTSGIYAQDNANLFFDNSTNMLGVGTATPLRPLHIHATATPVLHLTNDTTGQAITDGFDMFISGSNAGILYRENGQLQLGTNGSNYLAIHPSAAISLLSTTDPGAGVVKITGALQITTPLAVGQGGTGTATAFTANSVVFAGGSGVYTQDNTNFYYDDSGNTLNVLNLDFIGGGHLESENSKLYINGGFASVGGNVEISGSVTLNSRFEFTAGASTGKLLLRNAAETAGVLIDVSTDAILKIRDRTDAADASITALTGSFVAGTLASAANTLYASGTLSTTAATQTGLLLEITTAGSAAQRQRGMQLTLGAGYTGSASTFGISVNQQAASTGASPFNIVAGGSGFAGGNVGVRALTDGSTTGTNTGGHFVAAEGVQNFGVWGESSIAKNSATNVGVAGWGINTGTTPVQIGGYFSLRGGQGSSLPTLESAALIADNDTQASPIFLARDNGSTVVMIADGGNVGIGTTTFPSTGTASLIFGDGTIPATMGSNTAGIYANDVSGTVNMYAINEAGESTRLSFPAPQTYTETNVSVDRAYDANSTSIDEIADVLGTLIADLRARGIVA